MNNILKHVSDKRRQRLSENFISMLQNPSPMLVLTLDGQMGRYLINSRKSLCYHLSLITNLSRMRACLFNTVLMNFEEEI